jgi:hypothetical protein
MVVLPKPLRDKQIKFFRFWFNHQLQDGLHYQNEMFQRLYTLEHAQRSRLYQLGGHLAKQGTDILITVEPDNRYSLWINLRDYTQAIHQLSQGSKVNGAIATYRTPPLPAPAYATLFSTDN